MKNREHKQDGTAIRKLTLISTVALTALLILFLCVTLSSTGKLSAQIRTITEHPFTVNSYMGEVNTDMALMRVRIERLHSYREPEDIQLIHQALEELHEKIWPLINSIDDLYLGPDDDVETLQSSYGAIREAHNNLLEYADTASLTPIMISEYENAFISPLYEEFDAASQRILAYVRNTQQKIFISAEQMSRSTLYWSLVIVAAMVAALITFQFLIHKTNLRLYEKSRQFQLLSDTIDETFLIFGSDAKRCEFVSGNAEKMLGVSAGQLMGNRDIPYQYMNPETADHIRRELTSGSKTAWESEIEYHTPQSVEPHWLMARFYRTDRDDASKCIVTLTDHTAQRRANQALQDALASAQNANNAKRDFLSRMSHEIRTPMNAIIGMTTIAAASIEDRARVEDCLEKIGYSSKHLLMLINDVLDMSRIESDRMHLSAEPFDLYQFINTFISVVYPQARRKGVQFSEKTTGFSEHTTFIGDTLRLNQILLNLTSNAIKFTPEGGSVRFEVARVSSRDKKCWIRFVVSDTGIGMDEEALEKLYTPFEQANAEIAQKYGGTGLGMSITQNLTALMGGHIDVKSAPGQGTTFTVELPFETSDIDLQPVREESLDNLEVLVVDDERDICEHTALLLKRMKINAQWVLSGAQAVDLAVSAQQSGHGFDVCFIDWKMPDMDGVETTRRIREKVGRHTPIIIISAYDWSEIEEEARRAGANAFIAKPLFQSSLYNALVNVTNGAFGRAVGHTNVDNSLQGKRLLLAEDNALNLEIAVTLLQMHGAQVEGVENGQEAFDRFLRMEPGYFDAILMDMQMPVMDGCDATRHIRGCGRADAAEIPIIATTANAFTEDVSTVLAAGMNAHVSKPIDIDQLCQVLAQVCVSQNNGEPDV